MKEIDGYEIQKERTVKEIDGYEIQKITFCGERTAKEIDGYEIQYEGGGGGRREDLAEFQGSGI